MTSNDSGAKSAVGGSLGRNAATRRTGNHARLDDGKFHWALGIEDTCVVGVDHLDLGRLDEHALTGHDDHWRDDLRAVVDLGATGVRYGVQWPLVHTSPSRFMWSDLDDRLEFAGDLGLTVIADLVHYGAPGWLDRAFVDPRYPSAIADFAGRFARRYRGVVDHITPLNEPVTTASFSGLRGVWPPSLTGWAGWTAVTLGIAEGIALAAAAIKSANPSAIVVHVEASSLYESDSPGLEEEAQLLRRVGLLPTDLALGRVSSEHPMYGWLIAHGAHPDRLARLAASPAPIDIIGVNYYPDLSPRLLRDGGKGVSQVAVDRGVAGLVKSLSTFERRYGLPLLVTETSIEGDDTVRSAWLGAAAECVRELVANGMDLRGLTWWPLYDFVDWSYASGGVNVEEFELPDELVLQRKAALAVTPPRKTPFLRRMGLIRLEEQGDGDLRRDPTPAAALFRRLARTAERSPSR